MKNLKSIIIVLFLMMWQVLPAQQFAYRHVKSDDGLPGPEVFDMLLDRNGYIWFATNMGIGKFNGETFVIYTTKDGLPENSNIRLFEDLNGRIWFSSFSGYLSYFDKTGIISYPHNYELTNKAKNYYYDFFIKDTAGTIWVAPAKGDLFKINKNSEYIISDTSNFVHKDASFVIKRTDFGNLIVKLNYKPRKTPLPAPKIKVVGSDIYVYDNIIVEDRTFQKYIYQINKNELLVSMDNFVYRIKDNKIIDYKKYNQPVTGLFADNRGRLFICLLYEGVFYYPTGKLNDSYKVLLEGITASNVIQDNENNYWISTVENSVFFYPSFDIINYDLNEITRNNNLSAMDIIGNRIYFATFDKKTFTGNIEKSTLTNVRNFIKGEKSVTQILDIFCENEESIWVAGGQNLNYNSAGKPLIEPKFVPGYTSITKTSDDMMYFTRNQGFVGFLNKRMVFDFKYERYFITTVIHEDTQGMLWVGSLDGLYFFKNNKLKAFGYANPVFKSRIADIESMNKKLVVATWDQGIAFIENDSVEVLTEADGLNSNFVNTLYTDNDSVLWVGTNRGLCKIIFGKNGKKTLCRITSDDGLLSNEIKIIRKQNDNIWLATGNGLATFADTAVQLPQTAPFLQIENIRIANIDTVIKNSYVLTHEQNSIRINYRGINFRSPEKIQYKYRLIGHEISENISKNNYVQYSNLNPGNYKFELSCSDAHGNWTREPVTFKFIIEKPFYSTAWFIIILSILIFFVVFGISYSIVIYYKNEADNKKKLILAEQKALRSQMNPHFLFNALNSIKRFILENDADAADSYLTGFAMLMRKVLNNSKHYSIPLSEELETIRLYLDLEKMRFDGRFKYHIHVDDDLPVFKLNIPPMIIQPYLENAIWHGIMPKAGEGYLYIAFTNNANTFYHVTIIDNGIGRDKSAALKSKNSKHQSTGLKNIDERIELLNKVNNANIKSEITDLYDENNEPAGTKVTIVVPFLLN